MKRTTKEVMTTDDGYDLLELKNGKVVLLCAYHEWTPEHLEELAKACMAATAELLAQRNKEL